MTYGLLIRKDSERKSCDAIHKLMHNPTIVRQTGEQWPDDLKLVFRWGCTANTPIKAVVNKAGAIHLVNDKSRFRYELRAKGENIPITWFPHENLVYMLNNSIENNLPVVVRPHTHERGVNFFKCETVEKVYEALDKVGENYYISKWVDKAKEFRVFVVQNRIICLVEKRPNNLQLNAWGLAANWINYKWSEWPLDVVRASVRAHLISGLHFSAADVIVDKNGAVYVCELNTAPELGGNYYAEKFAKAFDWVIDNHSDPLNVDLASDNWKSYAHPSISDKAEL